MILTRRSLLAVTAAGLALPAFARAESADGWLAYEGRLRARLDDLGGGTDEAEFARDLFARGNRFRQDQGGQALAWSDALARVAIAHAADLTDRGFFAHESPEGFGPAHRVGLLIRDLAGLSGENIAYRADSARASTPAQFTEMWIESPGHRENMLREAYDHVGYGVVRHGDRFTAVGVFAQWTMSLTAPLPLRIDRADVLKTAAANAAELAVSAPVDTGPSQWTELSDDALAQGSVLQLRPMVVTDRQGPRTRYAVLWGPIFVA